MINKKSLTVNILVKGNANDDSPKVFRGVSLPCNVPLEQLITILFGGELYSLLYNSNYSNRRYSIKKTDGQVLDEHMSLTALSVKEGETLVLTGYPYPQVHFQSPYLPQTLHQGFSKRSILYYPSIEIPNNRWLRQSILYWDEISSIVPNSKSLWHWTGDGFAPYSNEVVQLESAGIFKPIHPEAFLHNQDYQKAVEFEKEFMTLIDSTSFPKRYSLKQTIPIWRRTDIDLMKIHINKVSISIFEFLQEKGLAGTHKEMNDWYLFEKNIALVYMALLAKYLADIAPEVMVTGTDRQEYQNLLFKQVSPDNGMACLGIVLSNVLPTPRLDVPITDIIDFKQRRETELLQFRQQLDEFQVELRKCNTFEQAKEQTVKFKEKIEIEVIELERMLKEASIATLFGSMEALIKLDVPTALAASAVALGQAAKISELPMDILFSGLGVASTIKIAKYAIDKRNEKSAKLRQSAFSYLYLAKSEELI